MGLTPWELQKMAGRGPGSMTHAELQRQVVELAEDCNWEHMHVRAAVGKAYGGRKHLTPTSRDGWPDLVLWSWRAGQTIACEVKVPPDRLSPAQLEVLTSLHRAGWLAIVVTPVDLQALATLLATGVLAQQLEHTARPELQPQDS